MKMWNIRCDADKYTGYFIKDKNIKESIDASINRGISIEDWEPIKISREKVINSTGNISYLWSIVGCFIADKKAKISLEKYFPGKIQFLEVVDDENGEELYLSNILECIEGIDYEKSVLRVYLNKFIAGVDKYVFTDDVLKNPIFKLKLNNIIMPGGIYVNDDFKNVITDIGLTGIEFEQLYDSEE
ncbi:imm11 family protein [Clostridium paraputrificum]|uniref:imm11 family protein n=1 Tax=Clostridium paraputrificum TaxID=29363 RepID=UPI003D34E986